MAEDQNRTLQDKFMLRLPDGMRERIKRAAEGNNRSMNAEIIDTLHDKYPAPTPYPEDILLRIEQVMRTQGTAERPEEVDILNAQLAAAGYPLRVEDDDDGMRLSILPTDDFPFHRKA